MMMTKKVCNATVGGHGWMMALFVRDPKSSEMYTRCEVTYNVKKSMEYCLLGYYIKILLSCQVYVSCLSILLCPNGVAGKSCNPQSKYSLSRFLSKQFVILFQIGGCQMQQDKIQSNQWLVGSTFPEFQARTYTNPLDM